VRAALEFLATQFPTVRLLVAGFSFGCWVGMRAGCEDARVEKLIAIGAPVNNSDFAYLGKCAKPKLFVHGSNDEHGDVEKVRQLVGSLPGENELVVVEQVDHFLPARLKSWEKQLESGCNRRYARRDRSSGKSYPLQITASEDRQMTRKFLPYWMTPEIMKAAAVMAAMLFVVSYLVDLTLMRLDVSPSSTILNDFAIAMIATGVMLFYLFVTHTQNIFLRAKERMNLTAELNFHLSRALLEFRSAAEVEDRDERLRNARSGDRIYGSRTDRIGANR
jgi:hypothetical protein